MLDAPDPCLHPLLGVTASATGRVWRGPDARTERLGLAIAQRTGLPDLLGLVLAGRGVAPEAAEAHLSPALRTLMPDPSVLRDMDIAAERLARAVRRRERVAVFGDYDVDGAASAALVIRWLRAFGLTPTLYVPDRIDEGYGTNVPAMQALGAAHDLVLCVDCGSLSHEPVSAARGAGADVLICDHHLCGETLPDALALVNPNRQDETAGLGHLCAAGVVFLLLVAANRALRGTGCEGPDLRDLLDLVALATVADVAPLTGLNRAFVRQGLVVLAGRRNTGLAALCDAARLSGRPAAFHLGFMLGPRVNAGGRVGRADMGARLLACDDPAAAAAMASELDALNRVRQDVEASVLAEAQAQAEARGADGPLVWAAGEGWHPGVVGIVASRLKERFDRPAVVIGLAGGEGKGSGRSIPGVDLGSAVAALAREGLLLKGGGHRMAAGLTVASGALDAAMAALSVRLARQGADAGSARVLRLDGLIGAGSATPDLHAMLDQAGPWGQDAPAPRFAFADLRLREARPVGRRHLRLSMSEGQTRVEGIAFGAADTPLGAFLAARVGSRVHVAGQLDLDTWGGRERVKIRIEDAAAPSAP